jgi:diaminopimelate decarboxylase
LRPKLTHDIDCRAAFSEDFFLHAVAVKANSIRGILSLAKSKGFGAECASISEAVHGLSLGFQPDRVVYDSPIKTRFDSAAVLFAAVKMQNVPLTPLSNYVQSV